MIALLNAVRRKYTPPLQRTMQSFRLFPKNAEYVHYIFRFSLYCPISQQNPLANQKPVRVEIQ